MADLVLKLLGKILALLPDDRRRLLDHLALSCPATPLTNADRQRRYRLKERIAPVTNRYAEGEVMTVTNRYADTVTKSNGNVTKRVTNRYVGSPLVSKDSTSLTSCVPALDSDSFLQADSKSLNLKTLEAFDRFWAIYPKRIGKGCARKAWQAGRCETRADFIIESVGKQLDYFHAQGMKYTPNPATWLNQKRWDDEPPLPSMLSDKTAGNIASLKRFVEEAQREEN